MTQTLILLFHPEPARSKANAALAAAAAAVPGVEVIDMQSLYPAGLDMRRDGEREARRLLDAARIALQFPVQWYSTPPLLKSWQDAVLTRMFYLQYASEGAALEGRPLLIAATAGNAEEAYRPGGRNMFAMADLFAPLRATAGRCGLLWGEPHVLYEANRLGPSALERAGEAYARRLADWIATTPARAPACRSGGANTVHAL